MSAPHRAKVEAVPPGLVTVSWSAGRTHLAYIDQPYYEAYCGVMPVEGATFGKSDTADPHEVCTWCLRKLKREAK